MNSLIISDGGHRFLVMLREGGDLPALPEQDAPPHLAFIAWWRRECSRMRIPYEFRVAEPQGIRIIRSLLKRHTVEELEELGRHFLFDYGERLHEDPRHFAIFASMVPKLQEELKQRE